MSKRRFLLLVGLAFSAVFPAMAYPPAPDHVIFGTVRDEKGKILGIGEGIVIAYSGSTEIVRIGTNVLGDDRTNFILRIPIDSGRMGSPYKATALLPASPITFRVMIGGVANVPIEVSRIPFSVGTPGGRTRIDLTLGVATDDDGLPHAWERTLLDRDNSGRLRTLADVRPGDDSDNDGLTNLQEFLLGTYALDKLDGLALSIVAVENGRARLRFATIPGRTYSIKSSTDLNSWNSQEFSLGPASSSLQSSVTGSDITLVDVWAPLPPGGSAFYRIYAK